MKQFIMDTFNKSKLQKLFVSTALGNFAGYVAGSMVTVFTTYHSVERRAVKNLFGILPRKEIVVHRLPEWLEWVLSVLLGFVVMEFVRYVINREKYESLARHLVDDDEPTPEKIKQDTTGK